MIHPHPQIKKLFPDVYKNFSFNVILQNEDIIKACDWVDLYFDEKYVLSLHYALMRLMTNDSPMPEWAVTSLVSSLSILVLTI